MRVISGKKMFASLLMALLMTVSGPAMQVLANEQAAAQYTVQSGDSLYKIAKTQLGSGNRWNEIYELNKDVIKDPSKIYIGQNLTLPGSEAAPATEAAATETLAATDAAADNAQQAAEAEQKEANQYAQMLYDAAKKAEPAITSILQSQESDKAHLVGLDYRLKSVESTGRKILLDAHDMEITVAEASKGINDSVRYTYIIDDADYVATTKQIVDTLLANGFTVLKFKNYWKKTSDSYQGINANFVDPNGVIFELQFHTPNSYDTKENKTHKYYEISRSETVTPEEKAEADRIQAEFFSQIQMPEGADGIKY